jgi:hypothetical protein
VVDAAGAIYVIGGEGTAYLGDILFNDVLASTDGGARPDSVKGGCTKEALRGNYRELQGTQG